MDGIDVFNTFGFKLDKREKPLKKSTNVDDYTNWDYNIDAPDWFTYEYKQFLTDYKVPADLRELLDNRVNSDLE
jgi:hypothetical protein